MTRWWRNGDVDAAGTIPLDSSLARYGDGVFETIRVDSGRARWLDAHLDRLLHSAATHLLPSVPARQVIARWINEAAAGERVGALRVVLTPGAGEHSTDVLVGLAPYEDQPAAPVRLAAVDVPHPDLAELGKHTSWAWSRIALRRARSLGGDDALLLRAGNVVETATASVVWLRGERWFACGESDGALASTTLRALRSVCDVGASSIDVAGLRSCDAVVLLSSLRLATPVACVDSHPLADSRPAAARLRALLLTVP